MNEALAPLSGDAATNERPANDIDSLRAILRLLLKKADADLEAIIENARYR